MTILDNYTRIELRDIIKTKNLYLSPNMRLNIEELNTDEEFMLLEYSDKVLLASLMYAMLKHEDYLERIRSGNIKRRPY